MSGSARQKAELAETKAVKAKSLEARKASARRAYEGGEMTLEAIGKMVRADWKTLKTWIAEGGWKRQP